MIQSDATFKVFERNPYYHRVDPAGNQLPYIDTLVAQIVNDEIYNLKLISGESDFAYMRPTFDNYTLFKENEASGDYTVYLLSGFWGSDVAFPINLTHPDPIKRKIFNELDFRIALSVAIDRDEINKVVYLGKGVPRQATIQPDYTWYKEEWGNAYIDYDPDRANRLLDEIGLNRKNKDGFRLRPGENKPFQIVINYPTTAEAAGIANTMELVKEFWEAVGISVLLKSLEQAFFWEKGESGDYDTLHAMIGGIQNFCTPAGGWAPQWLLWLNAKDDIDNGVITLDDFEGGKMPGEEPPDWAKDLHDWRAERDTYPTTSKEYVELSQKLMDNFAENILIIGTVGLVPTLVIAKNNIGNVPKAMPYGDYFKAGLHRLCDQVYIKE